MRRWLLSPHQWAQLHKMQSPLQVPKGALEALMLKEIGETPAVLRQVLAEYLNEEGKLTAPSLFKNLPAGRCQGRNPSEVMCACRSTGGGFPNKFLIIGAGSSWNLAILAEYLIEQIARIPVEVQIASEFRHRKPLLRAGNERS